MSLTNDSDKLKTFEQLFKFYHDYVKLLYSASSAENTLPQEVLFEINAAFDHLGRRWYYGESEESVVAKATSHLKRSCLDLFKIKLRETLDNHSELKEIDTSIIDNGEFDKKLHESIKAIKAAATKARHNEGKNSSSDSWDETFSYWVTVFGLCEKFDEDFYHNSHVQWAKRKNRQVSLKLFIISILASVVAGIFFTDVLWVPIKKRFPALSWGSHTNPETEKNSNQSPALSDTDKPIEKTEIKSDPKLISK